LISVSGPLSSGFIFGVELEHVLVVLVIDDFILADEVIDLLQMKAVAAVGLEVFSFGYF
jgi:hypothetical protein